ncbi:protein of unknown function [Agreia sp. COWG]|nr:protein of unknown function [Agreia sp. COWG]
MLLHARSHPCVVFSVEDLLKIFEGCTETVRLSHAIYVHDYLANTRRSQRIECFYDFVWFSVYEGSRPD